MGFPWRFIHCHILTRFRDMRSTGCVVQKPRTAVADDRCPRAAARGADAPGTLGGIVKVYRGAWVDFQGARRVTPRVFVGNG